VIEAASETESSERDGGARADEVTRELHDTDSPREYRLPDGVSPADAAVPPGEYVLVTYRRGRVVDRRPVTVPGDDLRSAAASSDTPIDRVSALVAREDAASAFSYPGSATVDIYVTASNGSFPIYRPVADTNVTVTVTRPDGTDDTFEVNTGTDGTTVLEYSLDGKPSGRYSVDVAPSESVDGYVSNRGTEFYAGPAVRFLPDLGDLHSADTPVNVSMRVMEGYEPMARYQQRVRIERPDGTSETADLITGSDGFADFSFTPTQEGVYELEPVGVDGIAVAKRIRIADHLAQVSVNGERSYGEAFPGEQFTFAGPVRVDGEAYANRQVEVTVYDVADQEYVRNVSTTTTEMGLFRATWNVPPDVEPYSSYEVRLFTASGERIHTNDPFLSIGQPTGIDEPAPETGPSLSLRSDGFRQLPDTDIYTGAIAPGNGDVFEATLRDADGNPIANEEVTLAVTYGYDFSAEVVTTRTNAQGVAAVTVSIPENAPHPTDLRVQATATYGGERLRASSYRSIKQYAWEGRFSDYEVPTGQTVEYEVYGINLTTREPATDLPVTVGFGTEGFDSDAIAHDAARTGSDGRVTTSVRTPSRPVSYQLTAADTAPEINPYRYSIDYIEPFEIAVDGPGDIVDAGTTVEFNFTTELPETTTGIVTIGAQNTDYAVSQRVLFTDSLTEGETATVEIPSRTVDDTWYAIQVIAATDDGRIAYAAENFRVNSSLTDPDAGTIRVPDDYDSIQAAVDAADPGDRIEVAPGRYAESVVIRKDVTLVAPDGATVANDSVASRAGIQVFGPTTPTVSGFTLTGWTWGFSAGASEGAWTLRDTEIRDSELGIGAARTPAPWTVSDVTVVDARIGLTAYQSSGDWTVRDSTFRRSGGISASESDGNWTVERTRVRNSSDEAINAIRSNGRWTVANSTLVDNRGGITADRSTNAWTVRDTVVVDTGNDGVHAGDTTGNWVIDNVTVRDTGGDAVDASGAEGRWTIRQSILRNATGAGVAAADATEGNATYNYWGASDGPSGDFQGSGAAAVGNVEVRPYYVDAARTTLSSAVGPNFRITDLRVEDPVSVGDPAPVRVTITNDGGTGRLPVDLRLDTSGDTVLSPEETQTRRSIRIGAGESRTVEFPLPTDALDPGAHVTGVTTPNDSRRSRFIVKPNIEIPDPPGGDGDGSGTGDPHLTTFDGVSYDFQAAGEFVLVRAPRGDLNVQARLVPINQRDVSVISAVATSVDGHNVTIDARDETPVSVDGVDRALNVSDRIAVGNGTVYRQGTSYVVVFPGDDGQVDDGDEQLRTQVHSNRIDARVVLDEGRSPPVEGLLGSPDGNASNDIVLADGTPLAKPLSYEVLYGPFREDYRVTASTSLFDYDEGEGPETFYDETFPRDIVTVGDLDEAERQRAAERAREAGLEPGTPEFDDAVLDFALTGDSSYVGTARRAANETEATEDATPPAGVRLDDRSVANGSTVVIVDRATYTAGPYYLTVHRELTPDDGVRNLSAPVGVSSRLAEGTRTDVTVELGASLSAADDLDAIAGEETLVAVLRRADVRNETFGAQATTGAGPVADGATITVTPNRPPTLRASLASSTNNVDAPVQVTVTATDPDGVVDTIRLRGAAGTDTRTCGQSSCEVTLSVMPREPTWNGSGYVTRRFTVRATDDDDGATGATLATKLYIAGDATGDGTVNIFDAVAVGQNWQTRRESPDYDAAADLNNDGVVNIFDAVQIGRNWNRTATTPALRPSRAWAPSVAEERGR
jgi:hypothetical protein